MYVYSTTSPREGRGPILQALSQMLLNLGPRLRGDDGEAYFICGNANSTPLLAVFGHRCMTALCRV
jgi:hypothetical protein